MSISSTCMHVHYVCTWSLRGQKRATDHLGLKLQMIVSHYVDAGIKWNSSARPTLASCKVLLTTEPSFQPIILIF